MAANDMSEAGPPTTRELHQCRFESAPEPEPVKGSDGWTHIVTAPDGTVWEPLTLAEGVQLAKAWSKEHPAKEQRE